MNISLRPTALLSLLALSGAFTTNNLLNPGRFAIERLTIPLANLPGEFDGMTIAHISDLHVDEWLKGTRLTAAMRRVSVLNPDVIVITGDFVSRIDDRIAADLTAGLRMLHAREGIYAVLGNHDYWKDARKTEEAVCEAGITMLSNKHITLTRGDQHLYIAGVDDIYEGRQDLEAALAGIPQDACTLLLAHEPDYADEAAADGRVAMQFSGHSHGGQFRFPWVGPLWLPAMGRNYVLGLYEVDDMQLYVNRGLGVTGVRARINCPAEITHITLRRA